MGKHALRRSDDWRRSVGMFAGDALMKEIDGKGAKIRAREARARLEGRIEDLEDLRDLEQAIRENAGKPLIPWEQAKA